MNITYVVAALVALATHHQTKFMFQRIQMSSKRKQKCKRRELSIYKYR
jgi:hypothetical protein